MCIRDSLYYILSQFLTPLWKKIVRGAPIPSRGCACKIWSFSGACKNLGAVHPLAAEIWSSEKCALGGYNSTSRSPRLLDQTSPDLFRQTQEESLSEFDRLGGLCGSLTFIVRRGGDPCASADHDIKPFICGLVMCILPVVLCHIIFVLLSYSSVYIWP